MSGPVTHKIIPRKGHADPATTHQYLESDLAAKEATLRRLPDPNPAATRFRPGDRLLAFLDTL